MQTTLRQMQFRAPGTKPVEIIAHERPVAKQPRMCKCDGCKDVYPSYDMEGSFCTECFIEIQGQREHERCERNTIREF